jgi:hypothetical protein
VAWVFGNGPPPETPFAVRSVWHSKCDIVGDRIFVGGHVDRASRGCAAWPADWSRALDAPTDAVVVILGLRQLFDLDVDGQRLALGSPEWEAAYRGAVRNALGVIRAKTAAPVLWFDVPCYRWGAEGTAGEEHDGGRLEVVNAVLRSELAADPGAILVPYAAQVCTGTDPIDGLRPDGAHPTAAATHDLWRWLTPIISGAVAGPH